MRLMPYISVIRSTARWKISGRGNVYGLLAHHADDLLVPGGRRVFEEMQRLLEEGLVRKIGVSVYSGQQIDSILELYTPDIVQLPLNLFDQRLLESGHLEKLKRRGVEIHARSVFLQGLLLIEPDQVLLLLSVRSVTSWSVMPVFSRKTN